MVVLPLVPKENERPKKSFDATGVTLRTQLVYEYVGEDVNVEVGVEVGLRIAPTFKKYC